MHIRILSSGHDRFSHSVELLDLPEIVAAQGLRLVRVARGSRDVPVVLVSLSRAPADVVEANPDVQVQFVPDGSHPSLNVRAVLRGLRSYLDDRYGLTAVETAEAGQRSEIALRLFLPEFQEINQVPAGDDGENGPEFEVGNTYTRAEIQAIVGAPLTRGGNWATGYHQHNGEWFLFPTIGAPGRTGHDYNNRWVADGLHWFGKTGSRLGQPAIDSMLAPGASVHLFTRSGDRDPFEYRGLAVPVRKIDNEPVEVVWGLSADTVRVSDPLPDEVPAAQYSEGAVRTIQVNARERDPAARRACLTHWGVACVVCGMEFRERYGPLAAGYIHVHHLDPLGLAEGARRVDPVADLRPVCPNCHAVLHLEDPPLTIEQARALIRL